MADSEDEESAIDLARATEMASYPAARAAQALASSDSQRTPRNVGDGGVWLTLQVSRFAKSRSTRRIFSSDP